MQLNKMIGEAEQMAFDIVRLWEDMKEDIYIYGTGLFAQEVCRRSVDFVEKRVRAFVVTNVDYQKSYLGKPVYGISELAEYYRNEIILVAVSGKYKTEIEKELKKYKYHHILYLTDYECDEWALYKGNNLLEYRKSIQNWYRNIEKDINSSFVDPLETELRPEKNEKMIIFISGMEMAMPRDIKIMKALKKYGYEVIVLCYGGAWGATIEKEMQIYSISMKQCNDIEELMYKMLSYNPLLYYIEPVWGDCSWANVIIQQKELFGKIVITLYDVFNDGLVFASEYQKSMEQYALQNADGIVWRWFAKQQLEKQGMKFRGISLQFLDYCNGDYEIDIADDSFKEEEVKLCFICGHPEFLFKEYTEMESGYCVHANAEDVLERIKNKNCCFHVFVWNLSDGAMEKCRQLEDKYDNFKVFFGYEHYQLLNIIEGYDYGCFFGTAGKKVPDEISVDGRYLGTVLKDAIANKFFDYLDAGLPVVATIPYKMCDYLNDYKVLIRMDTDNLDVDYLRENRAYYKKNVKKARTELSIDNQITRMTTFFHDVAHTESINV